MSLKDFMFATNSKSGFPTTKLISLDFGKKRVGVAISDNNRKFVFPLVDITTQWHRRTLKDDLKLLWEIRKVCRSNEVGILLRISAYFSVLIFIQFLRVQVV